MIQHKDDISRTKREFDIEIDPKLRAVLLELDHFIGLQFGINITITCLVRTSSEQIKLNPGRPRSSHCNKRGADIRSHLFSPQRIAIIERHMKDAWGDMVHFKHHDSGSGDHLHLNVNRAYATRKDT